MLTEKEAANHNDNHAHKEEAIVKIVPRVHRTHG